MTPFEKSCEEFKKKYGYLTPKQQDVIKKIKLEREQRGRNRIISFGNSYDSEWDRDFHSAFDWGSQ